MKYLLMIYGNEELWSSLDEPTMAALVQDTNTLQAELRASGEWVGAWGVGDQARCVTLVDGAPVVTDGPYIEAKEHLASFDIIDCESEARALEIAARAPFAKLGQVEVLPLMHEATEG